MPLNNCCTESKVGHPCRSHKDPQVCSRISAVQIDVPPSIRIAQRCRRLPRGLGHIKLDAPHLGAPHECGGSIYPAMSYPPRVVVVQVRTSKHGYIHIENMRERVEGREPGKLPVAMRSDRL